MLRQRGRLRAHAAGAGRRAAAAKSRPRDDDRASLVATANPGCHLQIARGLRDAGQSMDVAHPVSLLARAYRREREYANEENRCRHAGRSREDDVSSRRRSRAPGPKEAVVAIAYTGVNFIDVYFRTGLYKADTPIVLGSEASGTVESVGTRRHRGRAGRPRRLRDGPRLVRGVRARARRSTRQDSRRRRFRHGGSRHAAGDDGALPDALDLSAEGR